MTKGEFVIKLTTEAFPRLAAEHHISTNLEEAVKASIKAAELLYEELNYKYHLSILNS